MCKDILASVKCCYQSLTRVEQIIADYLTAHAGEVSGMTITQFSDKCGVAQSTVFRFCRRIANCGFPEFRMALALSLKAAQAEPELGDCIVAQDDPIDTMEEKIYHNSLAVLRETKQMLGAGEIDAAVDRLLNAERVLFIGVGSSMTSAIDAYHRFLHLTPKVCCSMDVRAQELLAGTLTSKDMAVAFSYSGSARETVDMARQIKRNGAYLVGITRFAHSPLFEICDQCFLCGGNAGPFQSGKSGVKIAHAFLMESLCVGYCVKAKLSWTGAPRVGAPKEEDDGILPSGFSTFKGVQLL